jgi:hypothetical protein
MSYSIDRTWKSSRFLLLAAVSAALVLSPLAFAEEKEKLAAGSDKTLTGEVIDLMCYADHNSSGAKHAECAATCIKGGGPVAILSDGKAYLVVGNHKPMNDELAEYAGKTITLRGKLATNGGIPLLENAEIVKK